MLGEKGVSIIGSLIESLVGALAEGCSGVAAQPLRGRCAAVVRFRPGLALRLAEGRRGLCRAQPVIALSYKGGLRSSYYSAYIYRRRLIYTSCVYSDPSFLYRPSGNARASILYSRYN